MCRQQNIATLYVKGKETFPTNLDIDILSIILFGSEVKN